MEKPNTKVNDDRPIYMGDLLYKTSKTVKSERREPSILKRFRLEALFGATPEKFIENLQGFSLVGARRNTGEGGENDRYNILTMIHL